MVSNAENRFRYRVPSDAEILRTVKQMGPAKAPGSNGFTASFYQRYWSIVGQDICYMIRSFFSSGFLLRQLNSTSVALLPKVNNPSSVDQFRPIGLCNVSYKIISKILANRLEPLLSRLISTTQSTFIPNRTIQDNSITTVEIMHSMKHKFEKAGLMAIKLDMAQAYDRLE